MESSILEMELRKIRKISEKSINRKYEFEFNPIEPKFCSWGFDLSSSFTNEFYTWMHRATKEEKKNIYDIYRAEVEYVNKIHKENVEILQEAAKDRSCILRYRYSLLTKLKQLSAELGIDHQDCEMDRDECVKMPKLKEISQGPFNDETTRILLNLNRDLIIKMNINPYREEIVEILINPGFKYNAVGEEVIPKVPEKFSKIEKMSTEKIENQNQESRTKIKIPSNFRKFIKPSFPELLPQANFSDEEIEKSAETKFYHKSISEIKKIIEQYEEEEKRAFKAEEEIASQMKNLNDIFNTSKTYVDRIRTRLIILNELKCRKIHIEYERLIEERITSENRSIGSSSKLEEDESKNKKNNKRNRKRSSSSSSSSSESVEEEDGRWKKDRVEKKRDLRLQLNSKIELKNIEQEEMVDDNLEIVPVIKNPLESSFIAPPISSHIPISEKAVDVLRKIGRGIVIWMKLDASNQRTKLCHINLDFPYNCIGGQAIEWLSPKEERNLNSSVTFPVVKVGKKTFNLNRADKEVSGNLINPKGIEKILFNGYAITEESRPPYFSADRVQLEPWNVIESEGESEKEINYFPNPNLPADPLKENKNIENREAEFNFCEFKNTYRENKEESDGESEKEEELTECENSVRSDESGLEYLLKYEDLQIFSTRTLTVAEKLVRSKYRFLNKPELIEKFNEIAAEKDRLSTHIKILESRLQLLIEARKKKIEMDKNIEEISELIFLVDHENIAEMDLMVLLRKLEVNEQKCTKN
ncbi:hypothetical protein V9T40_000606 [Parthenolecanium corni]|uniref:Uncharacterized protein n=1 Tax=Parthenolecanium corni TaxID=536013 RepID=A0AAN9T9U4_9HEMI